MNIIDWEELYRVLEKNGSRSDIKYKTTDKLQKDCINLAQEELKEKSDIRFEYELVRMGHAYKRIIFHIYPNTPANTESIKKRQEYLEKMKKTDNQLEIPRDLTEETQKLYDEYINHNGLFKDDIDLLLKIANYKAEDVRRAIIYTDKQDEVLNYMGYIIRCIEGRYFDTEPVSVVEGSREKAEEIKTIRKEAYSDETKKRVWESTKKKDNFQEFLEYEERVKNISFIELDELFEPADAVAEYVEWRKLGIND